MNKQHLHTDFFISVNKERGDIFMTKRRNEAGNERFFYVTCFILTLQRSEKNENNLKKNM